MSNHQINLHEAIYSLSDALDLVGVTHIHHGKRVAYMAAECGKQLGWDKPQLDKLFQSAILHDCGVSKTMVHAKLAQLEWEQESKHCIIGAELLTSSPLLKNLAPVVLHHHTHWNELSKMDLPDEVKLSANCIYMVDRVDVLTLKYTTPETDILLGMENIRGKIADRRNTWFNPELVDCFLDISDSEAFWFSLESEHLNGYVNTWLSGTTAKDMSFSELRSLIQIFSYIVDAKSPFTREHSDGVASLARYIGELFGLPEKTCELLELTGLLHDIGKLRIPDNLLEKPSGLTVPEASIMRRHSFDSYNILKDIRGLEEVALWAAQHHERANGTGYPFREKSEKISLEASIIMIADMFQALAQRRPYREALPPDEIMHILKKDAAEGKLDNSVVGQIETHLQQCWEAATQRLKSQDITHD